MKLQFRRLATGWQCSGWRCGLQWVGTRATRPAGPIHVIENDTGVTNLQERVNVSVANLCHVSQIAPKVKMFSGECFDANKGAQCASSVVRSAFTWRWITSPTAWYHAPRRANMRLFTVPHRLMTQMPYQWSKTVKKTNKQINKIKKNQSLLDPLVQLHWLTWCTSYWDPLVSSSEKRRRNRPWPSLRRQRLTPPHCWIHFFSLSWSNIG